MNLSNKVVLVTGASRGIGQAIALTLARAGATVIGTATTENGANKISEYFKAENVKGEGLALNVTDMASIEKCLQYMEETVGLPQILVNNAGITRDNLLLRMDDAEWDDIMLTNLTSVFRMSRAVMRSMFRARWGRIINISSVVGATGNAGQTNYAAAKAGVVGFSKSLAQEMASRNITVNTVAPGFIESDMTDALPDVVKTETLKRIPMKRMGKPDDIANAVLYLASDMANYITGTTIHVNGGMFMA